MGVIDDGFDHEICGHETIHLSDTREHLDRVRATFPRELLEASTYHFQRTIDGSRHFVVERHPSPRGCDDLSDPASHLPGAYHENVLEPHRWSISTTSQERPEARDARPASAAAAPTGARGRES